MNNEKLIIAFSKKSNKLLARIFCRRFKHCCVLFPVSKNKWTLVQIGTNGVRLVKMDPKRIQTMINTGWVFIETRSAPISNTRTNHNFLTCVGFAKRAIGIRDRTIWTPDGLYKKLIMDN